jgi:hypothetical protein
MEVLTVVVGFFVGLAAWLILRLMFGQRDSS